MKGQQGPLLVISGGAQGLTQLAILLNQVHLGKHVDVGKLHMQHGRQGRAEHRDKLGRVCAVM